MPAGKPGQPSASPDLVAALWLLAPVVDTPETAWAFCQAIGLAPPGTSFPASLFKDTLPNLAGGDTVGDLQESLSRLSLETAQLHQVVAQLSGGLFGASFGSPLALHLIVLHDPLALNAADCLRLTESVWPQVMHEGGWSQWYDVLQAFWDRTVSTLDQHDSLSVLGWLSACARWTGALDAAQAWLDRALMLAARSDGAQYGHFALELGILQRIRGRLLSAESTVKSAREHFVQAADSINVTRCTIELAQIALDRNEKEQALHYLSGIPETPQVRALQGEIALLQGDIARALTVFQEIIALGINSRPNQGRAFALLGKAYWLDGNLPAALEAVSHAIMILQETGDALGHARALALQGQILIASQSPDRAVEILERAYSLQRAMPDEVGLPITLSFLLKAYPVCIEQALDLGKLAEAEQAAARLLDHSRALEQLPPPRPQ